MGDLEQLPVCARRRVLAEVRRQLVTDPLTLSRRKKVIVGERDSVRQLRVGDYRVEARRQEPASISLAEVEERYVPGGGKSAGRLGRGRRRRR